MPTKKLQLHVITALVLALVFLLVSCPADNPPADSNTQSTVSGTNVSTAPEQPEAVVAEQLEPAQGNVEAEAAPDPLNEEPGTADEANGDEERAAEKQPKSKNYRPPVKEDRRPKKQASRKKSFVTVEMRLISAEYNDAEDSTLSRLELEFCAKLDRMKRQFHVVELDDIHAVEFAEIDLGLCKIEIYPVVQQPNLNDVGSLGSVEILFKGMYQIRVYLEDGELIGIFGIYSDGTFGAAPMKDRPEGFRVKSLKRVDSYDPKPFTVYRKTPVGEKPEELVTIQFAAGGFGEQTVEDPAGHRYKYRFPEGTLELYDPNEK